MIIEQKASHGYIRPARSNTRSESIHFVLSLNWSFSKVIEIRSPTPIIHIDNSKVMTHLLSIGYKVFYGYLVDYIYGTERFIRSRNIQVLSESQPIHSMH